MAFTTKPKGIHATFAVDCHCGGEFTVTNGRHDPHDCDPPDDGIERLKAAFDASFNNR